MSHSGHKKCLKIYLTTCLKRSQDSFMNMATGLFCIFYILIPVTIQCHNKDTDLYVENWSCMFDPGGR